MRARHQIMKENAPTAMMELYPSTKKCLFMWSLCCAKSLEDLLERMFEKVQVGKDQEKAQSEKDSHSKDRGGKKPN